MFESTRVAVLTARSCQEVRGTLPIPWKASPSAASNGTAVHVVQLRLKWTTLFASCSGQYMVANQHLIPVNLTASEVAPADERHSRCLRRQGATRTYAVSAIQGHCSAPRGTVSPPSMVNGSSYRPLLQRTPRRIYPMPSPCPYSHLWHTPRSQTN